MNKAEPYRVRRTANKSYELRWPPGAAGLLKVSVTDSPLQAINSELVFEAELDFTQKQATITLPESKGTLFFHLLTPAGEEHVITDRIIPAEGVRNFRDFGGYRARNGMRVRWQQLYRSGHLGSLTEPDRQRIAALGIELVCDFRTQKEMDLNPSSFAAGHQPKIVELQLDPGDNLEFIELMKTMKNDTEGLRAASREKMMRINRELALSKIGIYRKMFSSILETDGASLIHCSAGKDRTGFGAALILTALGVPEATIFHDYLLTNELVDTEHSHSWFTQYSGVAVDKHAVEPMFSVHTDYLKTAFDTIKTGYGDMDSYLRDEMKLAQPELTALRQRFLENAS